jgi:predicted HTH transcriptional regulator
MDIDDLEKLLEGGTETPQLDFKDSCPWSARSFAKDFLAMSNTIDGGRIIIGVSEKSKGIFTRSGLKQEHKITYQIDTMRDQLAKYADPFVEFSVLFLKDKEGIEYVVLKIDPFREIPIICKVCDQQEGLIAGGLYYRNRNRKVESALVSNSYDMRDIIERAMLKMRYKAKQIGYSLSSVSDPEIAIKTLKDILRKERGEL